LKKILLCGKWNIKSCLLHVLS